MHRERHSAGSGVLSIFYDLGFGPGRRAHLSFTNFASGSWVYTDRILRSRIKKKNNAGPVLLYVRAVGTMTEIANTTLIRALVLACAETFFSFLLTWIYGFHSTAYRVVISTFSLSLLGFPVLLVRSFFNSVTRSFVTFPRFFRYIYSRVENLRKGDAM